MSSPAAFETMASWRMKFLSCISLSCLSLSGWAQTAFPPPAPDVLATPNLTMLDPEFNYRSKKLVWLDIANGDIWVGSYDPASGNFIPPDGRGTLIEAAVSVGGVYPGLGFTLNGPEWALGTPNDYVVYTRTNAGGDPTPRNALIGVSTQKGDGSWTRKTIATTKRNGPYGSLSRSSSAKITYQDDVGTHYARTLTDSESEVALPGLTAVGLTPVARFADTANVVAYQIAVERVQQSAAYNLDTGVLTQLTFDPASKDQSWLYSAPEFNGALALVTIANKKTIRLYAPVTDVNGKTTYEIAGSLKAPQGGRWFSLEPFVYQGHTYVLSQLTMGDDTYPTSIWLGGFDTANPILRQLTPNGASYEARADGEFVPLSTGVMITYSKFDTRKCKPSNPSSWLCMEGLMGLFRADTGLPPPQ